MDSAADLTDSSVRWCHAVGPQEAAIILNASLDSAFVMTAGHICPAVTPLEARGGS